MAINDSGMSRVDSKSMEGRVCDGKQKFSSVQLSSAQALASNEQMKRMMRVCVALALTEAAQVSKACMHVHDVTDVTCHDAMSRCVPVHRILALVCAWRRLRDSVDHAQQCKNACVTAAAASQLCIAGCG